jgi:hypothetical protein
MMTKEQVLSSLIPLINIGETIIQEFFASGKTFTDNFISWKSDCESTLEILYGAQSRILEDYKRIYYYPPNNSTDERQKLSWYLSGLTHAVNRLKGFVASINRLFPDSQPQASSLVFISHGGSYMGHVNTLSDFLVALGTYPVVVCKLPNQGLSLNKKVQYYMSLCNSAIVLATLDDEIDAKNKRTRPNVDNEIGMLQAMSNIGNRIIYLKEPNVAFASNYSEKVWYPMNKKFIQNNFIEITKDLTAFGII